MMRMQIRSNTISDRSLDHLNHLMAPAEPRACGCVQPPLVRDQVAPYVAIENISVRKITPEYKIGMEPLVKMKTPPMKAT